jgi:hypothetical protein
MTIGTTSTFQSTRDEICTDALVNLGAVAPGKDASATRTAGLLTHAARALNRLVKSMDSEGQFLWRVVRRTQFVGDNDIPVSGTYSAGFTLLPDVLDVDEPMSFFETSATIGTPISSMSRDEFMVVDRQTTGVPNRYYAERTIAGLAIYLIPLPSDQTASIEYAAFVRAADFNSGAETPDFLQKWTACLVYGLTAELAAAYGQPQKIQIFRDLFLSEKAKLLGDDNERGPLRLVPFGMGNYG